VQAEDRFFVARSDRTCVDPSGNPDRGERTHYLREWRWWSPVEIRAASGVEAFAPARLGDLLEPIIADDWPEQPLEIIDE
jgi:hypothetical protein